MEPRFDRVLTDVAAKRSSFWQKTGERQALALFKSAAARVPAYKDFLKKNRVNPEKIKSFKDFSLVTPTDKYNYVHAYPYEKLFWDGDLKRPITIHATSGSTGEPTYFQRRIESDLVREVIIENFFRQNDLTLEGPTLFIVSFGMGVWSAGLGIYTAAYLAANWKELPISIISPGVNKLEVLKILKRLAPRFKQVIIAGYPPFVKDIMDDAKSAGIRIKDFKFRFVFTGEAFTEEFRDYIMETGSVENMYTDTMNTYGTSELGAIAVETPLAILGRRLAYRDKNVFRALFGETVKTPTLAQYIPHFVNFECVNGELFVTGDSAAPLVRYETGDNGGIMTFDRFREALAQNDIDLEREAARVDIAGRLSELPLVYVYERKNLATTLYGILIYPEFVKRALFKKPLLRFLTGKFTMITRYDRSKNQYLELNLELRKDLHEKVHHHEHAHKHIMSTLRERSSEFRELSDQLKRKSFVKVVFWPYEHHEYFAPGNKQKWVKKI